MSINKNILFILEQFITKKSVLQQRDIVEALPVLKLSLRQIQKYIKVIKDSGRIIKIGEASETRYLAQPIQKLFQKYYFLFVFKNQEKVGILVQRDDDFIFMYDSHFLINNSEPIPTLPLSLDPIASPTLFPIFEENLPEGINKDIIEIGMKKTNDLDKLDTLTHNIGDLHFSSSDDDSFSQDTISKKSYLSNLEKILGTNSFPNELEAFTLSLDEEDIFPKESYFSSIDKINLSGISGFQYKKLLEIDFKKKIIYEDNHTRGYIFKPYSPHKAIPNSHYYLPHLAINEHLFMTFAKNELGFRVPQTYLIKREQDKEYHYLVKRFDRLGVQKYSKVTFATYLGLTSETKYNTSSEKMFTRIKKELVSKKERMNLLRYYFYSMLIVHEDMHTKNLSLMLDGDKTILAPLYDIATTAIYPYLKGYESHLSIDGKQTHITPKSFKKLVDIMDIKYSDFKSEASIILQAYIEKLPEYFENIQLLKSQPMVSFMKKKVMPGSEVKLIKDSEKKEIPLSQLLLIKHQERIKSLEKLGWLDIK